MTRIFYLLLNWICLGVTFSCQWSFGQPASIAATNFWSPNAGVYSTIATNGILYIGGSFSHMGPITGGFAAIEPSTGNVLPPVLGLQGFIFNAVADAQGRVYVGGDFKAVGSAGPTNLARLTASGEIDNTFAFISDAPVSGLAIDGNRLFVGGNFKSVNGQSISNLAVIDTITGQLTAFPVTVSGMVRALAVSGSKLFLGGTFTNVSGASRKGLAAIDLTTGIPTAWNPPHDSVFDLGISWLVAADGIIYVVGDFTQMAGVERISVAAFNVTNEVLTPWNARATAPFTMQTVSALTVSSNAVYLGGAFLSLGGQARRLIGAVDKVAGDALPWNPGVKSEGVHALAVRENVVYVGGPFLSIATNGPAFLAALDVTTGASLPLVPLVNQPVSVLLPANGVVYVGGGFSSIGGIARAFLAAIDLQTGQPTAWAPNGSGGLAGSGVYVTALEDADTLFVAGRFQRINGQSRTSLAAIDLPTGGLLPFTATPGSPTVVRMATAAGKLFLNPAVGENNPKVLDTGTGGVVGWDFAANDGINSFAVAGNTLYLSGAFTQISGQPRSRLAAFDIPTRQLLAWHPVVNNTVTAIAVRDQSIVVAGTFLTANGQPRSNLAAFDFLSGDLALGPTALSVNGEIRHLTTSSNSLYLSGDFTQVNGSNRNYFAAIDLLTSRTRLWDAGVGAALDNGAMGWHSSVTPGHVFIAGRFTEVAGRPLPGGFAAFPITNSPPFVQILTPTNWTIVNAPAQIPVEIQADSAATAITRVDVYVKDQSLISLTNAPYSFLWNVPKRVGDYLLTAVAYDQYGEFSLSPAARVTVVPPLGYIAPTLAITAPASNSVQTTPGTIAVQVAVTALSSEIENVQILMGTNVVATLSSAPYEISLTNNFSPGTNTMSAQLIDEYGIRVGSAPLNLMINARPSVTLQTPLNGSILGAGSNQMFRAVASDLNDTIANLWLFRGTELMASSTVSPLVITWTNVPSGYYDFRAVAMDTFGASATSSVAQLIVFPTPAYSLILDNPNTNVTFSGSWSTNSNRTQFFGSNFRTAVSGSNVITATAIYRPLIPADGFYDVHLWYPASPNGVSTNSRWEVVYHAGTTNIPVDQTKNGGKWQLLASSLYFLAGTNGYVSLANDTGEGDNRIVMADAVRFSSSTPPFILSQPKSITAIVGSVTNFTIGLQGSGPFAYQWRFKGNDLADATQSVLAFGPIAFSNAGAYSVVVSNVLSMVVSSNALLTVLPPNSPRLLTGWTSADGHLVFHLQGDPGVQFVISSSTNLVDWVPTTNIVSVNGVASFIVSATNVSPRFYRAVWVAP